MEGKSKGLEEEEKGLKGWVKGLARRAKQTGMEGDGIHRECKGASKKGKTDWNGR